MALDEKKRDPIFNDGAKVVADRKKPYFVRLCEFGSDMARVLPHLAFGKIYVAESKGRDGVVAKAGQDDERDDGPVAPLDVVFTTCRICSVVGGDFSRRAVAMASSCRLRLK
jgi:hypothetical protein